MKPTFLLVAAVEDELCGLDGRALGVGIVAASVSAAHLCATLRPSAIVLVGTAGSYGEIDIGSVVEARSVGLVSGTATLGKGYVPRAPPPLLTQVPFGLAAVDVATLVAITTDPSLAAEVGKSWQIEHMEAYGVAAAAAAAGIPFGAVFGVTNRVGPDAHAEWRTNRVRCQEAAAAAVARALLHR